MVFSMQQIFCVQIYQQWKQGELHTHLYADPKIIIILFSQ